MKISQAVNEKRCKFFMFDENFSRCDLERNLIMRIKTMLNLQEQPRMKLPWRVALSTGEVLDSEHYIFERRFLEAIKRAMKAQGVTARYMAERALTGRGEKERGHSERAWYSLFARSSVTGKPQRLTLEEAHAMTAALDLDFSKFCTHIEMEILLERKKRTTRIGKLKVVEEAEKSED